MEGPLEPVCAGRSLTPCSLRVAVTWDTSVRSAIRATQSMIPKTTEIEPETALDELFEILSHPTRRRILSTLANRNPRDEEEFQTEAFTSDDDNLEQFLLQLSHLHLPKLAEAEFIDWNRETNTITRGSRIRGDSAPYHTDAGASR